MLSEGRVQFLPGSNITDCTSEQKLLEILQDQRVCKSHVNVGFDEASVLRGMGKIIFKRQHYSEASV